MRRGRRRGLGCGGAENAAFKSHGYNGTFEGNVFRRNSVGLPIWFDGEGGAVDDEAFPRRDVAEPLAEVVRLVVLHRFGIKNGPEVLREVKRRVFQDVVLAHELVEPYL